MGMGYQGFVKILQAGNSLLLLTTGSSVNLVLEPIYSAAVWGAGWYNAPETAHYADNAIRYEGGIDFDLSGLDLLWDFVRTWVVDQRAYSKTVWISPDGAHVYRYIRNLANPLKTGAFCQSCDMNTSADSFVTCSLSMVALTREDVDPAGGTSFSNYTYLDVDKGVYGDLVTNPNDFCDTWPLNPEGANINPIPYWRTNANLFRYPAGGGNYQLFGGGTNLVDPPVAPTEYFQTGTETVEWSISVNNSTIVLYTCNGDREPTAVLQGAISATGNVTLYNDGGIYDPILGPATGGFSLTNPYLFARNTQFVVQIARGGAFGGGASSGGNVFIELTAPVVEGDEYGIRGQSEVTNRGFTLKGLGGRGCDGSFNYILPPCVISTSTGTLGGPSVPV